MPGKTRNFLDHLHPARVRRRTLSPCTTLGLGIACLVCLLVLFATGITLFLYYVPAENLAYERILHITTTLHFGGLIRNLHFIAANALVVLAMAHLVRVFFTASYKGRALNWLYGLGLLALLLFANFTGYLLPWDQVSYWAIKVGASLAAYFPVIGPGVKRFILGGDQVGHETLVRSFALHAAIIPALMILLSSLHLWRIRKDGGLAAPTQDPKESFLPAYPSLFKAEAAVALLTLATLLGLALVIEAPIYERADPLHPPNPAKAPWYFVGFQEMVSYSAFAGGVIAPCLLGLLLVLTPLLDRTKSPAGQWFSRDRWWQNLIFILILASQLAFIILGQWFRGKNWTLNLPF